MALLGCALLLFASSIWWDNAANRGIDPQPATTFAHADMPRGGVNTYNLHAEVVFNPDGSVIPDNKVKRTFEMIAAANLHWVRVQFPWEDIEVCGKNDFVDHCRAASSGGSTWLKYDYIVEQAERNGLELIVRLDTPPAWARQNYMNTPQVQAALAQGMLVTGPPDDVADYGDFVAAVAERYRGRLRYFQIWNEPNLLREWNYHQQDPAQFVELLRIAYERIKAIDPAAVILSPALSPTDGEGDGANDLEYLQGMYDAGGAAYFDVLSAQFYGLGQPPTEHRYVTPGDSLLRPIDTKVDVGRVVLLREIMEHNGDHQTPVWISEMGWNSAPPDLPQPWGAPVSEELKAEYLVQAMERAEREWPWLGPMSIWMFRMGGLPPDPRDPTAYFQLVDFEFNPLPAYNRVRAYLADEAQTQLPPAQRNPVAAAAPAFSGLLVLVSSMWLFSAVAALINASLDTLRRRGRRAQSRPAWLTGWMQRDGLVIGLMGLCLAIFYWGSYQLPITALGAALFSVLALLRPDLALVYVIVTFPLFVAPKGIWDERFGIRPSGIRFPMHEFVLLVTLGGTLIHNPRSAFNLRSVALRSITRQLRSYVPVWLFLIAGTLGVVVAASRGAALREWRWLIVEPLLFYILIRYWTRNERQRWRIIVAWLTTGAIIAAVGLIQLIGVDLAALLPQSICFSERVVIAEGGVGRISSIYCHPNNLGLALGRIWPVSVALALGIVSERGVLRDVAQSRRAIPVIGCTLLSLLALAATLSKGALMGAFVALIVLGVLLRRHGNRLAVLLLGLAAVSAAGVLLLGLVFGVERLNPLGGSSGARVELWTSALAMIRDHPLTGVGLDQFLHYRNAPEFGDRYINPAARGTSEQNAPHPHNLILDALVRMGPLGLIALAWLVARFFRRSLALSNRSDHAALLAIGLTAGMAAALTHGLVDSFYSWTDLAFSFWLMLGLIDTLYATAVEAPPAHACVAPTTAPRTTRERQAVHTVRVAGSDRMDDAT